MAETGAQRSGDRISIEELYRTKDTRLAFAREIVTGFSDFGVRESAPAQIRGTLTDYSGELQFRADVSFFYETSCDRCLKPIKGVLEFSIDAPVVDQKTAENLEGEAVVCEAETLDLKEIVSYGVREYLPAKRICSDTCKGLCPTCGADLNLGKCSCKKPADPRLEGLKEFFNE